jgi:hypothetical protein
MTGVTLDSLPKPPPGYRPSKDTRREDGVVTFETFSASLDQTESRASRLLVSIAALSEAEVDHALDLHRRLTDTVKTHIPYPTLACALYMRGLRERAIGWGWYTLDQFPDEAKGTACLIPIGMIVPADDLHLVDPGNLIKRLRNDFDRCGVTAAPGFIFAGLDAEFDITRGVYHFHYQLFGAGEKIDALNNLRDMPKYDSTRREGLEGRSAEFARVQIKRGPFYNDPASLSYALKGYVAHHPSMLMPDGSLQRSSKDRAIPDPYHARWLLWRDRWKIGDFVLLSGMKVTKAGFVITSPSQK